MKVAAVICFFLLASVFAAYLHLHLLDEERSRFELEKLTIAANVLDAERSNYARALEQNEPIRVLEALLRYLGARSAAGTIDPVFSDSFLETYSVTKRYLLYKELGLNSNAAFYRDLAMQGCESWEGGCLEDKFESQVWLVECALIKQIDSLIGCRNQLTTQRNQLK